MSRTYRRTDDAWTGTWFGKFWAVSEWRYNQDGVYLRICYPKDSKEYKKASALYHSDAGSHLFKEPGPSWWRREFYQRPYRRRAKKQLHRYVQGEDIDVIIEDKPRLDWWT